MLDHISIPVADVERAAVFYDAVLATIGLRRRRERPGEIGYGSGTNAPPVFWILERHGEECASPGVGFHVSFQAPNRPSVDSFHETAIRLGGRDAGKPGLRPQYTATYYGAFVLDLDGFKIEAVCRAPQ